MNDAQPAPPAPGGLLGEARRIVSEIVGNSVHSAVEIRRGRMTFKYSVQTAVGDCFVVRFYPARRATVVDVEPDLLRRCRRAGMPVPVVIADSRQGPRATLSYVIYQWIEGKMLSECLTALSEPQQKDLARELAGLVYDLQQVELRGFGELSTAETAPDASWLEFVNACCQSGLQALKKHALLDDSQIRELEVVVTRTGRLLHRSKPQLVWGDISFDNVLVAPSGRVAGLIDFEGCLGGDGLATLGYCFAIHGNQPFCAALNDAWPAPLALDDRQRVFFYAILRGLRLAPYAHQPLPTGYPRDPLTRIFPGLVPALSMLTRHCTG
jgi:aminoglycoside phosphotransferase (APT) family kinase protein